MPGEDTNDDCFPIPYPGPPDDAMTVQNALINPATFVAGMRQVKMWSQVVNCPFFYTSAVVRYYVVDTKTWRAAAECVPGNDKATIVHCFDEETLRQVRQRFVGKLPV